MDVTDYPTGEVMRLSPLVARVLAPNPSPFTYTGTQTYLVGERDLAIIDAGPDDPTHIEALMRAIGARTVRAIMSTHTHRDHSPGSRPLKEATGAPVIGCAPLALDDDGPRADAAFDRDYAPDAVLSDGQRVAGDGWTLQAVATPGHTSNHLCFALREEKALFTGDHVMGWSTSVISPPDGDMAAYMASMQKLLGRDDRLYYPAHGEPVDHPHRWVRSMMGHRKHREGQILRHLRGHETASVPEMVEKMYKGVDSRLHGAAGRSVLAHLIDLEARHLVTCDNDRWKIAA